MPNAIKLDYYWKKSFNPTTPTPFGMLCSFYDLMCWWDPENLTDMVRFNPLIDPSNFKMKGFELPHNIIEFDGSNNCYKLPTNNEKHRIVSEIDCTFEYFQAHGIDISMPRFDLRSKPLFLTQQNIQRYVPGMSPSDFSSFLLAYNPLPPTATDYYKGLIGFKVWDKNAIMKPMDTYDFYTHSPGYQNWPPDSFKANMWKDYAPDDAMYLATEKDGVGFYENCDICLNNEDLSFETRFLSTGTTNISAWNGLCLNPSSTKIWNIIWKQYGFQAPIASPLNYSQQFLTVTIDPIWKFLMQNTYVFVKASFFADYVDYKDFDQYLNKTSNVIHKNLLVSPTGDLDRYNKAYSAGIIDANELAKNTRPYISKTPPSHDIMAEMLLPTGQFIGTNNTNNMRTTVANIIADANGPDSKIGALNVEPFEYDNTEDGITVTTGEQLPSPPTYFDPESRKTEYAYNDIPIVVPKDGNIQTSGRLISPTIDELWQEIKMLMAGRQSDEDDKPDGGYPHGTDNGLVGGNFKITVDSRPPVVKNHLFNGIATSPNNPAVGDPVSIDYDFNDPVQAIYTVAKWVNNPSSISYSLIKEIDSLNDLLCQAIGTGSSKTWKKVTASIYTLPSPNDISKGQDALRYNPNKTVFSLRELEGIVRGLQWNLSYLVAFLVRNNTFAGSVGYYNDDISPTNPGDVEGGDYYRDSTAQYIGHAYNVNNGTAYQLHKDYDGNYVSANSRYDQRVNNGVYNAGTNPYGMPSNAIGLGLAALQDRQVPDRQAIVPSYAVFMAADGQWHAPGYQYASVPIYTKDQETW